MLYLKNVKRENDYMTADYYPEDWGEYGTVSVNYYNLDDYTIKLSPTDERQYKLYPYAINALNALRDMVEGKRDIKDCVVMWF